MDHRKLITGILLCFACSYTHAQVQAVNFSQADSLSYGYYLRGNWEELIAFGKTAVHNGIDFPLLRERMGYAWLMKGNYSQALAAYQQALKSDSHNQVALFYTYLCNTYLNRSAEAALPASKLEDTTLAYYKIKKTGITEAGAETSLKFPEITSRGSGTYCRVFLKDKPAGALQLDQSVAFFNQYIFNVTNQQLEYYARLSYPLTSRLVILGAYHYLNSSYQVTVFNNHIGVAGLRLSFPFFDLQGDVNLSSLDGSTVKQYNAKISCYPAGNLNIYAVSKASVISQGGSSRSLFSQTLGAKISKKAWLEGSGTFGGLDNFLEADGLYVYNNIDETRYKAGATTYLQLGASTQLTLNYAFESKNTTSPTSANQRITNRPANNQPQTYNQHSLSGGILWKF